ncbi:MAG: hypothetical protein LBC35_03000 [Coriobacteriales bacterium]|jgi:hypothetical protein|nr:hypothetical protein [Coriobacteriales bacterium]
MDDLYLERMIEAAKGNPALKSDLDEVAARLVKIAKEHGATIGLTDEELEALTSREPGF